MNIDKTALVLGSILYPLIMLPFMSFIAVQVYQINARTTATSQISASNTERITIVEQNVLNHLSGHSNPTEKIPTGMPLVHFKDRRDNLRIMPGG